MSRAMGCLGTGNDLHRLWRSPGSILSQLRFPLERGLKSFTVIATLLAHRSRGLTGEKRQQQETTTFEHLAIVGGFLFVVIHGAGRMSVDNLLR